ncbi:YggS family pyridoxal phosphate-dependent enzyme [Proteocatella sphenisci]|uniref:YggS family pyridoxal phosphate-dependent enzyme n=1 Tax=Proteocatella sphenisci TaxID=181070 RepID=UPI00048FBC78|nr:YggS family pyridoxal phosphate-dependent enzyme [Proteocatella sphenisci]
MSIEQNLSSVIEKISNSVNKSKFNQVVELIAVTKTVESDKINEVIDLGTNNIGENKVQEIQRKYSEINTDVNWHLIGTLQTNKVKYIADKIYMIHSLDRVELAKEIDKQAKKHNRTINCLIQVKLSEEDTKHGTEIEDVMELVKQIAKEYSNIKICGLMGMAPYFEDSENARPYFKKLRSIFDEIKSMNISGVNMQHLSMGMSNDYEIAIEEGATFVRVGTAIFGERDIIK